MNAEKKEPSKNNKGPPKTKTNIKIKINLIYTSSIVACDFITPLPKKSLTTPNRSLERDNSALKRSC